MADDIITTKPTVPKKYQWKGNKKQRLFIEYWIDPVSETFGNVYRSGLKAGFSNSYSMNLTHLAPAWISESIEKLDLQDEHIKQGIQQIAISAPDSRSPDDTRLKAYETLARIKGIIDNKQSTNVTLVQPILSGRSVHTEYQHQPNDNKEQSDVEPTSKQSGSPNVSNNPTNPTNNQVTHSPDSYIEGEVVD